MSYQAEQEKEAAIIRAEGESEAAAMIAKAMDKGNGFLELRKIEAAKDIAETLSKSRNVIYLPGGSSSSGGGGNSPSLLLNIQ
jgi:prohibitin 1